MRAGALRTATWVLAVATCVAGTPGVAAAQQTVSDVLSFLLTNRSIPTDDFVRDEQAAAATRDSLSALLLLELATLPIGSSAGGFAYRLDPTLGTVVRSSDSFGPFFTERALTAGRRQSSLAITYQAASFETIDGRPLRDGSLVATASRLRGEAQPFDVETLTLRVRSNTLTVAVNHGVTDRLDVSAAVPFVRLTLTGQRLDTYRGTALLQAAGSATASGLGDVLVRAKYTVVRSGASGLAVGGEARLPTGDRDNLLGGSEAAFRPRIIGSLESSRAGLHGELGYVLGGLTRELDFAAAATAVAWPTVTFIAEVAGRHFDEVRRLTEATEAHPRLSGVETVRLTGALQPMTRVMAMGGVKWNVAGTLLVNASVMRPLTDAGLNAGWVPTLSVDYSFGR
jgi:Putative MetA-pathway of phenol degradation